jgi:hypothetical protein
MLQEINILTPGTGPDRPENYSLRYPVILDLLILDQVPVFAHRHSISAPFSL